MTAFDPATYQLEADLSRADVRVLYNLCANKDVIEFGCGGSTVLLAQFAASVRSYDTDVAWIDRVKCRMEREPEEVRSRLHDIHLCSGEPPTDLEAGGVYFIDGYVPDRAKWVAAVIDRCLADTFLVHDSRSSAMNDIGPLLSYPRTLALRSLTYHADGSNMLVIKCGPPCEWSNWNATEPENRLPFLS